MVPHYIGDIEDGKRYPFGVYSAEECDEKFVTKEEFEALLARLNTGNSGENESEE